MLLTVRDADAGSRIDVFLAANTDLTRSAAQKLLTADDEAVSVNGMRVPKNYRCAAGDVIELEIPEPVPLEVLPEDIPLDIVYEDDDVILVNKPKGMVVHPAPGNYTGTLVSALLFHCGDSLSGINGVIRPGIVHRIDRDTSGVLVVAKNDTAHVSLAAQIKEHSVNRVYHAIVLGNIKEDEGTVDAPLARHPVDRKKMAVSSAPGARRAVTHYTVLERFQTPWGAFTYCRFRLETGRTHQIRVHMAYKRHPLLGDPVYGVGKNPFEQKMVSVLCGQCLHAKLLGFVHPRTGQYAEFETPLPAYFETVLMRLREAQK
ncbi:MAG: RluA family pseudouridine synthase [Clostridia bacterium]|nr:RluA family pseudouridine synthase [Clostridia bacterium]